MAKRRVEISVTRKLPLGLTVAVAVVTALSLAGQFSKYALGSGWVFGLVPLFDVDREANLPTWYSTVAILIAAVLLAIAALAEWRAGSRFVRHWVFLSAAFVYLSLDEAAVIHERSIEPLREALPASPIFFHAWVVPAAALAVFVLLSYWRFLGALPARTRRLFLAGGGAFLGGGLGLETLGGSHAAVHGKENLTYVALATLEELLEMVGIVVFIAALVDFLRSREVTVELRFGTGDRARLEASEPVSKHSHLS